MLSQLSLVRKTCCARPHILLRCWFTSTHVFPVCCPARTDREVRECRTARTPAMEQASDLVVLSRLTVQFSSDERSLIQTTSRRPSPHARAVKSKVRWQRECKHLGGGTFGQVYMERCMETGRTDEKRAVKSIEKIGTIDYKRELEALAVFSYKTEVGFHAY